MANLHAEPNRMQATSQQMRDLSRRIMSIRADLEQLMNQSHLRTSSYESVRRSLRTVAESSGSMSEKVGRLSEALNQITAIYERTEGQLANGTNAERASYQEFQAAAEKIRGDIREISGLPGMDPAALYSNDPVNLSNGNYVYEKTFFHFDTPISINFRIFYNARGAFSGVLGNGWSHCFERRAVWQGDTVQILNEDGSLQIFRQEGDSFTPGQGTVGTLSRDGEELFYTDEERVSFRFGSDGTLRSEQNRDGWRVDMEYQEEHLTAVHCTDNLSLRFNYHENGRLSALTDDAGRTVEFLYDGDALTEIKDPAGAVTSFRYDDSGRLSKIIAPTGVLSVENEYDTLGRTVRQIFADGGIVAYRYEDADNAVVMRRQNGSEVTYYHDKLFRNTRTVYPDGEETVVYNERNQRISFTDKLGRTNRYHYDESGNLLAFMNAAGNQLSFAYNESGQLTRTLLDGEEMDSASYDEHGHQILHKNASGGEVRFQYDSLGRIISVLHEDGSETRLSYDVHGNVISVEDPVSGRTEYAYDKCQRVVRTVDALGHETHYEYDAMDQLVTVVNAEGNSRRYQYDLRGNLTQVVDFNGGITTIAYNVMNRPVRVTDPDGNTTVFEYDLMSNPIRKVMADGGIYEYGYDAENRMTSIRQPAGGVETAEYDAVGNLLVRRTADGGEYHITYDALNRPVSIIDPVGGIRRAAYDKLGNVTEILYEDGSREYFTYDAMGHRLSHTDQTGYTRTFQYDVLGNLTQVRDEEGVLAEYVFGPGGQLLSERRATGESLTYTYDPAGNVTQLEDSVRGIWRFSYNSLKQMIKAEHVGVGTESYSYDALGNLTAVVDGEGNRTAFQYTLAGALQKVVDAAGVETGYLYDPCYRLKQILQPECGRFDTVAPLQPAEGKLRTTTYERDLDGNVISVLDNTGGRIQYGYDLCGRVSSREDQEGNLVSCTYRIDGTEDVLTFNDGRRIQYQYDALKRLSRIEDWLGITRVTRDAAGRIREVTDAEGHRTAYEWNGRGQCTKLCYPDGSVVSYEYDHAMRLSRCISGEADVHYAYYENGQLQRREFSDTLRTDYTYDAAGRISALTHRNGDQVLECYAYSYDACSRKNRITEFYGDGLELDTRFSYDSLGRLAEVMRNGVQTECYEYDHFGNRRKLIRDNETFTYGYDTLNRLIWSRSANGESVWTYDRRGNLTSESINGVRRLSLHFDSLNRLAQAVSDRGEASYTYNGLGQLARINMIEGGRKAEERLFFDYSGEENHLLGLQRNSEWENYVWDREPLSAMNARSVSFFLNDERMTNRSVYAQSGMERYAYDPFGVSAPDNVASVTFAFAGYRYDRITGFYDGGWRQYDAAHGRFISQDPVAGELDRPITLNPYLYCCADPVNYLDPTGMIVAWLAGGIVGAVANVGVKFAGDVINSVKNGKWTPSSWESYVGAAAGGFVQGSVFAVAGPVAAGAAGAATESFVTNGLSMVFKEEGYRAEDGYNAGKLLWDTGTSAVKGGAAGFAFNWTAKYIKIPGITKGKGSFISVWKQVMTKAQRGIIANVTGRTMMKGLMSYGLIRTLDTMLVKGKEALQDYLKEKGSGIVKNLIDRLTNPGGSTGNSTPDGLREMVYGNGTATCSTA